ncbi:MAG: MOSC domain-containing protein [Anaerolineae bacterium]|nr:MOSC domain-containing protein [Anaerolineae bacterium]
MHVLSVNVAEPRQIIHNDEPVMTGIYKTPATGRVPLDTLNFAGDRQADLVNHGGIHKAVYAYPHEHYAYWAAELDRHDFEFGQFGENLTLVGLLETEVYIGNTYRVGDALLEVTQPRVPCFKLAHRMGLRGFEKAFLRANRLGFYLRVREPGNVGRRGPGFAGTQRPNADEHCGDRASALL